MIFNSINDLYFFTATILNWKFALMNDERKELVIESLRFLKENDRIKIYGFVIMPNHIHLLWQNNLEYNNKWKQLTQGSLLKFTANIILRNMDPREKALYKVDAKDRTHQIWEREPLWVECHNMQIAEQKLNYIHNNPCQERWKLVSLAPEYKYSSAGFYETGRDEFGILSNIYD